jgi:ribonuclease HII
VNSSTLDLPDLHHEQNLLRFGYDFIGGIDEAGRGAWAGPVFAAVVILPDKGQANRLVGNVRDSKQMTPRQRGKWAPIIKEVSLDWGVGSSSSDEIDKYGILPATRLAASRALLQMRIEPNFLLLDYILLPECTIPQDAMVKGDQISLTIAAASVLAKTTRDAFMRDMHSLYPAYSFDNNKGYGTRIHWQALNDVGICPIHRRSYKPIAEIKNRQETGG